MLINGKLAKLGKKKAAIPDKRNLKLADYLKPGFIPTPSFPAPQAEVSWVTKLAAAENLPMYGNDVLGDCVEAMGGHQIQQWSFYAGKSTQVNDSDVIKAYSGAGGYVPGDPSTDNGTDMATFMKYWQKVGIGGHKIIAYMDVDWTNHDEVQIALQLFGSLSVGIQLPVFVQGRNDWIVPDGGIYSDQGQPGSWGGHGIPIVASSPITKTCITWGMMLKMSNNFFLDYVDECRVALSQDWINSGNLAPNAINLPQLEADLTALGIKKKIKMPVMAQSVVLNTEYSWK